MMLKLVVALLLIPVDTLAQDPVNQDSIQMSVVPVETAPKFGTHWSALSVEPNVRARLAVDWDDSTASQHERAYCGRYSKRLEPNIGWFFVKDPVMWYNVYHVERAIEIGTSTVGIRRIICPKWNDLVLIHTHPPTECERGGTPCVMGGKYAWQCFPSDNDVVHMRKMKVPFSIVQCDRHALVPFFQEPYPR